jgi:beta propeller repeat protein
MTGVQLALPNATLFAHAPKISGTNVTWYESPGGGTLGDIYYTDLASLPPVAHKLNVPASEKTNPGIDGDAIVWQDIHSSAGTTDILLYNTTTSTLYNLTPGTDTSNQEYPSIAGGRVVWQDNRNGEWDIFYNDTSDWSLHSILASAFSGEDSFWQPITDGSSVVLYDHDSYDILMSNLALATTGIIDSDGNPKFNPAVCSTFVVWKENLNGPFASGPYDIALYNTATTSKQILTDSSAPVNAAEVDSDPDYAPVSINGDSRIVWVDDRNENPDIYMFTLGVSTSCPIVQFSTDKTYGNAPLTVQFTDTSLNAPTQWRWNFGDGTIDTTQNPVHTYGSNGIYQVRLTAGTPYCRNTTPDSMVQTISVGVPSVLFSANVTEGLAPLPVSFISTATNSPTAWAWAFGDGGTSSVQNPSSHTYNNPGTYSVSLNVTNAVGSNNVTKQAYITSLNGMQETASTDISGININIFSTRQMLNLDKTVVSYILSPDLKTLVAYPSVSSGWQNVTFISSDSTGFDDTPASVSGNFSTLLLQTKNFAPTMFSASGVGNNLMMNYQMSLGQYLQHGALTTIIWENVSPTDDHVFDDIIHYAGFSSKNISYTMNVTRSNIPVPEAADVNLSVSSYWETGPADIATERLHTDVIAEGYDAAGDQQGLVLPASYVGNDTTNHIEYFLVDIPSQYAFMNKFALAKLSGSGNLFQLITLAVSSQVSSSSSHSSWSPPKASASAPVSAPAAVQNPAMPQANAPPAAPQAAPPAAPPSPPEIPKTANLYINANSVITQATTLQSNDNIATLSIDQGIVAHDSGGKMLSSVSITGIKSSEVPSAPVPATYSFTGTAYDLQPNGATFSPAITLTFTIPKAEWGKEYTVQSYDHTTNTWQSIPTTYDPSKQVASAPTMSAPVSVPPKAIPVPSPPAPTAVSTFVGLILWISETSSGHIYLVATAVIAVIALLLVEQRRRGRRQDLLR